MLSACSPGVKNDEPLPFERPCKRVRTAVHRLVMQNPTGGYQELAKRRDMSGKSNSAGNMDNELSAAPSMAGIKYARLENNGFSGRRPNMDHPGTATLHKDGNFTAV